MNTNFAIFGVPVRIGGSAILGVAFLAYIFLPRYEPLFGPTVAWAAAAGLALFIYVTVLAHELGHALSARALGAKVNEISLYALGGVTRFDRAGSTALRDGVVAAAGPAVTLVIAAVAFILAELFGQSLPLLIDVSLVSVAQISLILAIFNLAPALPLDGGVIVSSIAWGITRRRAWGVKIAAGCGLLVALSILASPYLFFSRLMGSSWVFFIFTALIAAWIGATSIRAWQESGVLAKMPDLTVDQLIRKAIAVSGDLPVSEAIRQAREQRAGALVVCSLSGEPQAIVGESEILAVPVNKRPWTSVASIMSPITADQKITAGAKGESIIKAMYESRQSNLLVCDDSDRIIGVVTSEDLERQLKS